VKDVLAGAQYQTEWPVNRQPENCQSDVKRAKDQCRPDDPDRVAPARCERDAEQGNAPHDVQQVVACVARTDRHAQAEPVNNQQSATFEKECCAEHRNV
jgi:hypothetical protein